MGLGSPGSFDDKYIEGQQILKIGSKYVLLYHAFNGIHWTEGLAFSDTLHAPFIKYQKNPVFTGGPANSWDGMHVSTSYLYFIQGHWYLFYQGTNSEGFYSYANWDIGMAELKDPDKPVFPQEPERSAVTARVVPGQHLVPA